MTDKLREAAQLALRALESCREGDYTTGHVVHPSFDEKAVAEAEAALRAALAQHSVYQLPDDLYPDSKCWVDSTYAERVEWLHTMYESSKQTLNVLLGQQDAQAVPQSGTCKQNLQVEKLLDDMLDLLPYNSPDYWIERIKEVKYKRDDHIEGFLDMVGPQQDAQAVPQWANAAFTEIAGCFDAAIAEGLLDALAETRDERLKDLVVRRLMYAHAVAAQAAAPTPPPQRVMLTDDEISRIYTEQTGADIDASPWALRDFARAVIEAYEIKNGLKP